MKMRAKILKSHRHARRQSGFTLIEILFTVFIVAIGFLGMASMQTISLSQNQSAYLKSQASVLVNDIADRMRMNIDQALAGAYDGIDTNNAPALAAAQACIQAAARCSPAQQVVLDRAEWAARVNGANGGIALLPAATGTVTRAGNVFTITVAWQDKSWQDGVDGANGAIDYSAQQFSLTVTL